LRDRLNLFLSAAAVKRKKMGCSGKTAVWEKESPKKKQNGSGCKKGISLLESGDFRVEKRRLLI